MFTVFILGTVTLLNVMLLRERGQEALIFLTSSWTTANGLRHQSSFLYVINKKCAMEWIFIHVDYLIHLRCASSNTILFALISLYHIYFPSHSLSHSCVFFSLNSHFFIFIIVFPFISSYSSPLGKWINITDR